MTQSLKITTELQNGHMVLEQGQRSHQAMIQNLERDVGRIANALTERPPGELPANTKVNPRNEHAHAIFTRSGVKVTPERLTTPLVGEDNQPEGTNAEQKSPVDAQPRVVIAPSKPEPFKPKVPFPQKLRKEKLKERYAKFSNLIKQVHINVPLIDLISGMPHYGKFIKDLVAESSKGEALTIAQLGEECSAAMTKSPPKLGDTGSFTIPCYIGNELLCNALADLGASINLMPLSLYSGLGLGGLTKTNMTIQLADRSIKHPAGIAENVPVRVGEFIFPVDFVILDMKQDLLVPIILGRPFLNTADAVIHVKNKTLSLGVGEERITFSVDKAMKSSIAFDDTCYSIDAVDECVESSIHLTPR